MSKIRLEWLLAALDWGKRLPNSFRWGLIVAIAIVAGIMWGPQAFAGTPQLSIEAGTTYVRGEAPTLALDLRWPDAGPGASDFALGTFFIGESTFRGEEQAANFGWYAAVLARLGVLELGIGPAWLQNIDAYNSSHLNYMLLARVHALERWRYLRRWHLTADFHVSNGGTRKGNRGRDSARIGAVVVF